MTKSEILQLPKVIERVKELEKKGFATHVAEELALNESGLCEHPYIREVFGFVICEDCGEELDDLLNHSDDEE